MTTITDPLILEAIQLVRELESAERKCMDFLKNNDPTGFHIRPAEIQPWLIKRLMAVPPEAETSPTIPLS